MRLIAAVFLALTLGCSCRAQSAELFEAVRRGDLEKLKELAADRANVDFRGLHLRTALHEAAANCQFGAARILVDAGWDRLALDDQRQTPAALAFRCQHMSVTDLQFVLSRLADASAGERTFGEGPALQSETNPWTLQYAVAHGQVNVVSMLLIMGARVNESSTEGDRALDLACLKGNAAIARILLDRGADPTLRNKAGSTPLHDAALSGNKDVIELLLRHGADPNATDGENGATPLHLAASFGRIEAARILVENGADASAKTRQGFAPLDLALRNGHRDLSLYLRQAMTNLR